MTATATTVKAAVKTAIDAISSPPFPFASRIADYDVADMPKMTDAADVVIGFEASQRLSRTGSTILEQHLIPITVRCRVASQDQSRIDSLNELMEVLRDNCALFHNSTMRVDSLLSPHPFDAGQAIGPGLFTSKFVMDLDVLRRVNAITQDSTTVSQTLTKAREAVWNAITNWPEFTIGGNSVWGRMFKSDSDLDELALHDPGEFDLPAIALTWGPTTPQFLVHTAQSWPMVLNVSIWFPVHQTTLAEYRAWQLVRAVYQGAPSSGADSYVKTATGRYPSKDNPITPEIVELGRGGHLKVLKITVAFTLSGVMAPLFD